MSTSKKAVTDGRFARWPWHRATRGNDQGFGLIEVIVALSLLMIATVPIELLVATITGQAAQVREKVAASGVAEQWLEHYNNLPLSSFPANLPATITEPDTTIAGTNYHASVQLQWAESGLAGNLCTPGSTPQVISAIANVTWGSAIQATAGYNRVQEQTVINPPYGLLQPDQGFLAIQVNGAAGPLTTPIGQTVTATIAPSPYAGGGASAALTVPAGGCIFTAAANGTYTVTLSSSGTSSPYLYVDNNEHTNPASVALTVSSGTTTSDIMTYDEGGAISLSYPSTAGLAGGMACPLTTECFAWGWGSGGADLLRGTPSGGFALVTLPVGVSAITDVWCESADTCYLTGIGASNAGVLLAYNDGTITSVSLPVPSTALNSVACLNNSTCYAVGADGAGAGVLVSVNGTTATNALPAVAGLTLGPLVSIECSNSNNCIVVGTGTTVSPTGASAPTAVVLTTSGTNWSSSPVPTGTSAATAVACDPFSGTNPPICIAAVQTTQPTVMASTDDGATWALAASFPVGVTGIGPMACTGPSNCVVALQTVTAASTTATTASTVDGANWATDTGWPSDLQLLTGLACPTSGECLASGVGASGAGVGVNSSITATSAGTWTTSQPGPSSYLSGIGCTSSTSCLTVGGSHVGPVAYVTSNGGSAWSAPPTGSAFYSLAWSSSAVTGLPITVSNGLLPGTQTYQPVAAGGASNATLIPNLYPFSATGTQPDYGAWTGDLGCLNEVPPSTDLVPIPVTSGTTGTATVPLTLLAVEAVRPNGTPISGAQVSLSVSTTGCPADSFGVPATSAAGLVTLGVPTGVTVASNPMTYSVTVSDGGQTSGPDTIVVDPTGVTNQTTGLTYPYPSPVPFVLNVP